MVKGLGMGRLIYLTPASLDGFIGDGDYSWSAPYAEEIKSGLTAGLADVGTYLYGRRTYETMAVWEKLDAQLVADIKAASRGDLTVGGPTLAAEALRLDLVDVVELLWCPVLLGGGIPVLSAGVRRDLRLQSERRFNNGVVQATYDVIGQVRP
jgi:dihydrofolate reductase